jgi:hypothetical protein
VRQFVSASLKRVAVGASVATLAFGAFGMTAASASTAGGSATIDTYGSWDGSTYIQPFGCPDTSTYGQTITIPAGKTMLKKFTFAWTDLSSGTFTVRGEVYAWDSATQHATGKAVGHTGKKVINSGHSGFYDETFKVKHAKVTAGQQYVIFVTLDKDYSVCNTSTFTVGWGGITDDNAYPGGTFVYQNNGEGQGGSANWTTVPWNSFGWDLAFKAYLK